MKSERVYKVIVVDDQKIVRMGCTCALSESGQFEIVGEFKYGIRALEYVRYAQPDVMIIDAKLSDTNGLDMVQKITSAGYHTACCIFTADHTKAKVLEAYEKGAAGIVLKDSEDEDIVFAVNEIVNGRRYFDKRLTFLLAQHNNQSFSIAGMALTRREVEIVQMIVDGFTTKDIADRVMISYRTVEAHRRRIMEKMEARNMADLVRIAIYQGIHNLDLSAIH